MAWHLLHTSSSPPQMEIYKIVAPFTVTAPIQYIGLHGCIKISSRNEFLPPCMLHYSFSSNEHGRKCCESLWPTPRLQIFLIRTTILVWILPATTIKKWWLFSTKLLLSSERLPSCMRIHLQHVDLDSSSALLSRSNGGSRVAITSLLQILLWYQIR